MKTFCKKIKETIIGFKQELELLPSYEDIKSFDVEKVRDLYKQIDDIKTELYDKYSWMYLLKRHKDVFDNIISALTDPNVIGLDCKGSEIGDLGAEVIADILEYSHVTWVNLGFNKITDEGVKEIAHALPGSNVRELYLADNLISDEGVKAIAEVLEDSKITELTLWRSEASSETVGAIYDKIREINRKTGRIIQLTF